MVYYPNSETTGLLHYYSMHILIMIFILFNYPLSNFLFPNVKSDASKSPRFELLKFFAYLVGGVLLIWQIYLTNRRTKASEKTAEAAIKSVDATLKGQVQERFKNAIDQLGNPNEAVNLGAIYTLHHIARDSTDLRKTVFDILCSYIRETTTGEYLTKEITSIKIQSIMNLLFIDISERGVYIEYPADLHDSYLTNVHLEGAWLINANLSGANLEGAELSGATLINANLANANMTGASLVGAKLNKSKLAFATLDEADLTGADLTRAELQEAKLTGATLTEANLSSAKLINTNLITANLIGANLQKSILYNSDLSFVELEAAEVSSIDWIDGLKVKGLTEILLKYSVKEDTSEDHSRFFLRKKL